MKTIFFVLTSVSVFILFGTGVNLYFSSQEASELTAQAQTAINPDQFFLYLWIGLASVFCAGMIVLLAYAVSILSEPREGNLISESSCQLA